MTIAWQPIPHVIGTAAPFDGEYVLLWVDIATVEVVRLGWWRNEDEGFDLAAEDCGWWSYRNSVTQEMLDNIYTPTHWAPYNPPARPI